MPTEYALFSIRIRGTGPDSYTVDVQSSLGGDASGTFISPASTSRYQEIAARLKTLDTDEDVLIELGTILFQSLFQADIKETYTRSQGGLAPNQGLRLRFDFDPGQPMIAGLPWEFLYDPDRGPLALLDTPVVRYLSQPSAQPTLLTSLPIKVLVTGAFTPPEADVERELAEVRDALAALEDSGLVKIQIEEHLTQTILQRRLREGFQVWHFIGHGAWSRDGRSGTLQFEDGAGSTKSVSAAELNILLSRSGIRLVMLDACNSAELTVEPYRSVAPALVRAQIPAVIAMQFTVPQDATRAFAGEFYRALAEGLPIDACVTEGRKAVMNETGLRNPDWGIPVVYTRAPDGKLFELPKTPSSVVSATPAATSGTNVSIGSGNQLSDSSININNVGNTTATSTSNQDDERTEQIEALRDLIKANRRRLNQRQLQAAKYGIGADPSISIEIEDLTKEIAKLERELKQLGG